jgi:GGDEF domain-containing protein
VARLGSDEFVVLQTGLADENNALRLAQAIGGDLARPYAIHRSK